MVLPLCLQAVAGNCMLMGEPRVPCKFLIVITVCSVTPEVKAPGAVALSCCLLPDVIWGASSVLGGRGACISLL